MVMDRIIEDVCSKEDSVIRCKLTFYYRRHVDPSKSNLNCTRPLSAPGQALRALVRNSLVGHASEILGGRKISRYPVGGFVERLGLRPVLLGIPCYWNMF